MKPWEKKIKSMIEKLVKKTEILEQISWKNNDDLIKAKRIGNQFEKCRYSTELDFSKRSTY